MEAKTTNIPSVNVAKPFKSTLKLDSATYLNVGYYYCVEESAITVELAEKIKKEWEEVGAL